jgi:hypothetical protein
MNFMMDKCLVLTPLRTVSQSDRHGKLYGTHPEHGVVCPILPAVMGPWVW